MSGTPPLLPEPVSPGAESRKGRKSSPRRMETMRRMRSRREDHRQSGKGKKETILVC